MTSLTSYKESVSSNGMAGITKSCRHCHACDLPFAATESMRCIEALLSETISRMGSNRIPSQHIALTKTTVGKGAATSAGELSSLSPCQC